MSRRKQPKNILEMLGINVPADNIHEFHNYLSEHNDLLYEVIKDEFNYDLIAKMKSGKTNAICQLATDNKELKIVLALPLQVNVNQLADKFKHAGRICGEIRDKADTLINPGTSTVEVSEMLSRNTNLFLVVYDSLPKLLRNGNFKASEYTLVVDEAHNLVTQYNYRYKTISYLVESIPQFKKVLYMTGTPEGTLYFNDHKTLIFRKKEIQPRPSLSLVLYESPSMFSVVNHILNYTGKGKIVLLKDDIAYLDTLRNVLVEYAKKKSAEYGREISDSIMFLSREEKTTPEFINLIQNDLIDESKKIILTTRVISDGVNIKNKDIDRIYIIDSHDHWMKQQFISRFREGVNQIYDFRSANSVNLIDDHNRELFLLKEKFDETYSLMVQKQQIENEDLRLNRNQRNYKTYSPDIYNRLYFSEQGIINISKEGIASCSNSLINKIMAGYPQLAADFYKEIAGYDPKITSFSNLVNEEAFHEVLDRRTYKNLVSNEKTNEDPNFIQDNLDRLFTAHCLYSGKIDLLQDPIVKPFINLKDLKSFYDENKNLLKRPEVRRAIFYIEQGYPLEVILILAKLYKEKRVNIAKKMLMALGAYISAHTLRKFPQLSNYLDSFNELKEYRLTLYIQELLDITSINHDYKRMKHEITTFAKQNQIDVLYPNAFFEATLDGMYYWKEYKQNGTKHRNYHRFEIIKAKNTFSSIFKDYDTEISEFTEIQLQYLHYAKLYSNLSAIKVRCRNIGDIMPQELQKLLNEVRNSLIRRDDREYLILENINHLLYEMYKSKEVENQSTSS